MHSQDFPTQVQPNKVRFPHWFTPILLLGLFILGHVIPPWRLSTLAARHGWSRGKPGLWNWLALILVGGGIASTVWMIALHYLASPRTFLDLKESQNVISRGPYGFSRNPMYLSELVFWFGWSLFYGSIPVLIGFLSLLAAFRFGAVPWEERHLEARFGQPYLDYKARVPRWLGLPIQG